MMVNELNQYYRRKKPEDSGDHDDDDDEEEEEEEEVVVVVNDGYHQQPMANDTSFSIECVKDDETYDEERRCINHNTNHVISTNPQQSIVRSISEAYFPDQDPLKHKIYGAWETILMAYQTLGVVYGDLGTSPLYVFSSLEYPLSTAEDFLGVLSLIFWSLTMIALVKYVFIVLRADDHGEGGTFALYSLLSRNINLRPDRRRSKQLTRLESDSELRFYGSTTKQTRSSSMNAKALKFIEESRFAQKLLMWLVMLGTCMVIGDGVLTPAISVLSAIGGIKSQNPSLNQDAVVIVSAVILLFLFLLQSFGTHKVSFLFSPIMVAWFLSTALIGVYNIIIYYPGVFKALSPHYIFLFFMHHGKHGWVMLGAIVLCITGAEAMFADLGHFNKRSIQIAFSFIVYPSLILTYAGEAAYLIKNPSDLGDAFFKSIPKPVFWPMFVVSTLAAIVASQALISATFSIVKQSVALSCFPRVRIVHTSEKSEGEVYSPEANYCLMILCIAVVLGFQSGTQIGNAFGVAVICVMLITTLLVTLVMIVLWKLPLPIILCFFCTFGFIEGVYLTSVLNKVPQGGWVPFAIAFFFLIIMLSWIYGRQKKYEYEASRKVSKEELQKLLFDDSVARVPGVCLFYSDLVHGLPPIISHYVRCVGTLHQVLVFVTIRYIPVRTVLPDERFLVDRFPYKGVYRCIARYGYMDLMSIQHATILDEIITCLKMHISNEDGNTTFNAKINHLPEDEGMEGPEASRKHEGMETEARELEAAVTKGAIYVLGKINLQTSASTNWLESFVINHLYHFLATNCRSALAFLDIPPSQFLQVGMTYQI